MFPKGLFNLLAEHPGDVIVFDDSTDLLKHEQARAILMAAVDGDSKKPVVSYTPSKKEK